MQHVHTSVLVAGGGVTGLTTAAYLASRGVPTVLVERRPAPSPHPRARGFNPRAVEVLRAVGLEAAVAEASRGFDGHTLRARVRSLTGEELLRHDLPGGADLGGLTPCRWALLSQDRLEPLIRARAEELGADVRFGTELTTFEQEDDGVRAQVVHRVTGRVAEVRAHYLVAADGPRSRVRERLSIPVHGRWGLHHQLSIVFDADLAAPLRGRRFAICQVQNDVVDGLLVHDDTLRQGTLYVRFDPSAEGGMDAFTRQRCAELVRAAIGDPDLPLSIRDTQPWELSAVTAARFRDGRVFLAGDAAHVMPPVSGFGASTGIQDAQNLAWKLAAVVSGEAGARLLDSYEQERLAVAALTVDQCRRRVTNGTGFAAPQRGEGMLDDLTLTFGLRYRSGAVLDEGVDPDVSVYGPADLTGRPGTRLPHVWLRHLGRRISTLDLPAAGPVLLAGPDGDGWRTAAARNELPLVAFDGDTDPDGGWERRFRAAPGEAILLRPDGYVAWRAPAPDDAALATAAGAVRGRADAVPTSVGQRR
ncbi:FAD-dependent monooxygenase [Micromonospora fiedleri]|uniref:FAD-dependent monooxygenase n=1 Tax=Micromonospora fiedleri TaxID=1157498 RepID=A0ABS1USE8_9ACTN|nr:FAD-dependent monooxygenase [Micromonospora fiedleri]MBL6279285.1 FAD-dependent monooxygenase [Micromonospora fiedleri]